MERRLQAARTAGLQPGQVVAHRHVTG